MRQGREKAASIVSGPRSAARATWVEVPDANGTPAAWCYTDRRLYVAGQSVGFHLSSTARGGVTLRVYRDGAKRALVHESPRLDAPFQPVPDRAYEAGCGWATGYRWATDADLRPGGYLVEIRDGDDPGGAVLGHHLFLVRAAGPDRPPMVLVASTSTWAAYDDFGGASHYRGVNPGYPQGGSPVLSAARPWARGQVWLPAGAPRMVPVARPRTPEAGRYDCLDYAFSHGLTRYYAAAGWASYERHFARWAEENGYALDVLTQDELHASPDALDGYACAVFVGHDEYWSREMRECVHAYLDRGGRVARFAGNFLWQVRLEAGGQRQVCYKYNARTLDPIAAGGDRARMTAAWEDPWVGWPGAATFGVNGLRGIYAGFGGMAPRSPRGFTVFRPEHWAFAGTGLGYADMFGDEAGIFAFEVDGLDYAFEHGLPVPAGGDGAPEGLLILAMGFATQAEHGLEEDQDSFFLGRSDAEYRAFVLSGDTSDASVARHSRGSGMVVCFPSGRGEVFTAGTCEWVAGLMRRDPLTEMVTRTVLDRYLREGAQGDIR